MELGKDTELAKIRPHPHVVICEHIGAVGLHIHNTSALSEELRRSDAARATRTERALEIMAEETRGNGWERLPTSSQKQGASATA